MTWLGEVLGIYVIRLPAGMKLLTSNSMDNPKIRAAIREAARAEAEKLRIPAMRKVQVRGVYYYPGNKRQDPQNLDASVKPLIDGALVDSGIIPDDNDKHLTYNGIHRGYPDIPGGQLALEVTGDRSKYGYVLSRM